MHLTDNVTTMHLVPVERRRPRTMEMVNVRGVPHMPSQRRISYVIQIAAVASPPLERFDAFLDDFVNNVNNSDDVYGKARRCETNDREIFALLMFRSFARSFLHVAFFPAVDGSMVMHVEAWSWEQVTIPLAANSDIMTGPANNIWTPRAFWGHGNDETLLRFVRGETERLAESEIDAFLSENEAYVAGIRRRARGSNAQLGTYEFRGVFTHHHTVLNTILSFVLPRIFTEEMVSLLYENEFEWSEDEMIWQVQSASFSQREVVDID